MNDKARFVFKMSRAQTQIALAMNQNSNLFLNGKYCFVDDTYERCPDFVTLAAYTYACLLRKMVKFRSMKAKSETAENRMIFWWLFNEVLQAESNTLAMFNPIGWCVDEAGGIWKDLKEVLGEGTIKYQTVSCEKHYMWYVVNFKNALLKISKSGYIFKALATRLMTDCQYKIWVWWSICWPDQVYRSKTIKKGFFKGIYQFWNRRQHHFSHVFKSSEAPKTNLRGSYHA